MKKILLFSLFIILFSKAALFANSRLIKNLNVWDVYTYNFNASHWIEQGNLQKGVSIYGEADIPIVEMPDFLKGADFLQTSVSSNNYSKSIIANFTIGEDATLYVAHSILVEKKPEWLLEYQTTNQFIKTRLGDFEIFSKKLKSGEEILLGNNGNTEALMYLLLRSKHKIR